MVRRTMLLVTLCAFLNCVLGCTAQSVVPKDELLETRRGPGRFVDARLHSGEIVRFDSEGGTLDTMAGTVTGVTSEGTPVELNCDDAARFCVERSAPGKTMLAVVGVVAALAVVAAIITEMSGGFEWDLFGGD